MVRALDGSVLKDPASEKDEGPDLETMALTHAELPSPTHLICFWTQRRLAALESLHAQKERCLVVTKISLTW